MSLTRKLTVEFAAVFLIGALAGALVMWNFNDTELKKFMAKTNDPESVIVARVNKKYADQFHLTPDEISRIQPFIKEMAQHISQIRRQFGVDVLANLDLYHGKIAEQLTPEHRAAYEKSNQERRLQISAMLLPDATPAASSK